jgi:dienelactone hydrolase
MCSVLSFRGYCGVESIGSSTMLPAVCARLQAGCIFKYKAVIKLPRCSSVIGLRSYSLAVRPGEAILRVSPKSALFDDDNLRIYVSGLGQHENVTIHSTLKENNMTFAAVGHYVAGDEGVVDTARDPSRSGSYVGVEPLGLLWGMEQAPGQRLGLRLMKKDVTRPYEISLAVHRGHLGLDDLQGNNVSPIVSASFERMLMAEGVQRIPVKHGKVRGTLFMPAGPGPFPAVIDMFGFIKGIVEPRSALLASRGIASLALPYLFYQDLPKTLDDFEIDYLDEATEFVLSQDKVINDKGIGVIGVSNGAGLALAMAEFIPKVKAVVAINGPCVALFGDMKYRGRVVKRGVKPDWKAFTYSADGVASMEKVFPSSADDDQIYHIENSDASFLFITGLDDRCTPIAASSAPPARLRSRGKTNFVHLEYPGAGHLIEPPCNPHVEYTYHIFPHTSVGLLLKWGGERHAHARAQADSWSKILKLFNESLR